MTNPTAHFFSDLPVQRVSLRRLLAEPSRFTSVPSDWHVIVTDIENSTVAVKAGQHEVVNLVATGSIIAVLNLARHDGVLVPFFFGGDGATLIVPPGLLERALAALARHRANTQSSFDLVLRVGSVPVADLYAESHTLTISRLRLNDLFAIPVVLGGALAKAERIVKGDQTPFALAPSSFLDLDGMECRWDRIEPAERTHEVVSLLVVAQEEREQASVFGHVVELLDQTYGTPDRRNPVSLARLRLKGTLKKLATETRARLGRLAPWAVARSWVMTRFGGGTFMRSAGGQRYLGQLIDLTDTLVIDGRINTVIAGTRAQREALEVGLRELETAGALWYGLAVSRESVLSCYVTNRADEHIHFVDGADGGYTLAAGVLKRKLLARRRAE